VDLVMITVPAGQMALAQKSVLTGQMALVQKAVLTGQMALVQKAVLTGQMALVQKAVLRERIGIPPPAKHATTSHLNVRRRAMLSRKREEWPRGGLGRRESNYNA
jgi:hypothetical protein